MSKEEVTFSRRIDRAEWWWLGAVCAIALLLRLIGLDAPLWYDEILTLVRFVRLPAAELLTHYTSLNNHVLYSLEAHGVIALLGEHPWTLRLPAALFGVGGVAATWWLARLVVDRWEAWFATAMLAVSYHHIWFSQNARGYTGLLFWTLVATAVFVGSGRQSSWRRWALYALSVGLAGYIHLSAAFFFATHAVIYGALVLRRRRLGASWRPEDRFAGLSGTNPLFAMLAGALLTVAFHAVLIPQILDTMSAVSGASVDGSQTAESTGTPAKWTNPLWMVFEVLRSFSSFGPLLLVAAPIAGTLMVVGARSLAKKNAVFVAIYVVYVPLTLALLLAAGFRLWPRYFLVEISFGFIAICRGIVVVSDYLETHTKVRTWLKLGQLRFSTVACGLALVASLVLLPKNYLYPKQDFEGAMRYVEQAMGSGDVVATLGLASAPYREYYKPEWLILETPQQLDELRSKHEATWVIYSFSAHTRGHYPEIVDMLKSQFEEMREFPGTLGDGEVVVWRARP